MSARWNLRSHNPCLSLLFHSRVFAKSICLQDKWPFSRRRWQATQRWYWIDFWNVAELTVWCIRADMNHKNSIKKALEWLTAEYYFWWLIWLSHYGRGSSQIASYKIAFHSLLNTPAISLSLSLSLSLSFLFPEFNIARFLCQLQS